MRGGAGGGGAQDYYVFFEVHFLTHEAFLFRFVLDFATAACFLFFRF